MKYLITWGGFTDPKLLKKVKEVDQLETKEEQESAMETLAVEVKKELPKTEEMSLEEIRAELESLRTESKVQHRDSKIAQKYNATFGYK